MSRKSFLISTTLTAGIATFLFMFGAKTGNKLYTLMAIVVLLIEFFRSAYVLIIKKSYNLLAGMTEERAVEISKNPEEHAKHEKYAQRVGYIMLFSMIPIIIFLVYMLIKF